MLYHMYGQCYRSTLVASITLRLVLSQGVTHVLMRTDPFRELDRLPQQMLGTAARPAYMPMDAWREDVNFMVEFDLPCVDPRAIDLDVGDNLALDQISAAYRDGVLQLSIPVAERANPRRSASMATATTTQSRAAASRTPSWPDPHS